MPVFLAADRIGKEAAEAKAWLKESLPETSHPCPPSVGTCNRPGHQRALVDHHPF